LFNSIIGEDRSITSDYAGTTRDSIYYDINFNGNIIKLVDTAGIRKRTKRDDLLEELSVSDSNKALQYANVAIMVLDATLGIDKMDLHIAGNVLDEGRAMVIAVNKWDKLDDNERGAFKSLLFEKLEYSFSQAKYCPVIYASALKGENVEKILNMCLKSYESWNMRIGTGKLNRWLKAATEENIPPLSGGKRVKLKYITQVKSRPPTFCIFTSSNTKDMPDSYLRYLKNSMDREFDFMGVPIRIIMRKSENPFEGMERDREKSYEH
jgi:GTP-binding protein